MISSFEKMHKNKISGGGGGGVGGCSGWGSGWM